MERRRLILGRARFKCTETFVNFPYQLATAFISRYLLYLHCYRNILLKIEEKLHYRIDNNHFPQTPFVNFRHPRASGTACSKHLR